MSKKTSGPRVQAVLRSCQAPSTKNGHDRPRQPKAGPATKASQAEPAPPTHQGCVGSRKGSVVALHRTDIGIGAVEVKAKAHNEPAHRGHKPSKADSSPERITPVGNGGLQRFGRGRNHASKRASG